MSIPTIPLHKPAKVRKPRKPAAKVDAAPQRKLPDSRPEALQVTELEFGGYTVTDHGRISRDMPTRVAAFSTLPEALTWVGRTWAKDYTAK